MTSFYLWLAEWTLLLSQWALAKAEEAERGK